MTQESDISQKSQQTGTQQYSLQGNILYVSSPEGNVQTYVNGQLVSSKTPAQVQLESQIISAGGTVTHDVSEQVASGLQTQYKEALAGEQPQAFQVTVPEGTFQATSGITPNVMAGTVGSVIPKGYYQNELSQIVPVEQKFKTGTGQEFTATPTGSAAAGGFIWQTPYGEVTATPEMLQSNIGHQMNLLAMTPFLEQAKLNLEKDSLITERASRIETGMAYGLYHPLETGKDLLSYAFPLFGETREQMQLQLWKERKDWTAGMLEAGPVAGIGLESWKLGGELFLSTSGGLILGAVASKVPALQPVLTGASLGLTTGLTAIGTIEMEKGIEEKSTQRFWGGAILAGIGALGTKAVWEAGVVPELEKAFPSQIKTKGMSVSNIEFKQEELIGGEGKGFYDTKVGTKEIVSKADFEFLGKPLDDKLTVSIEGGTMESKLIEPGFLGFGKKVTDLEPIQFGTEAITTPVPGDNDFFVSMFKSVTPKTSEMGLGISEKMFEGPSETIFKTFAETESSRMLSIDKIRDLTNIPSEFGSEGLGTMFQFDKGSIVQTVQKDILGMHGSLIKSIVTPEFEPSLPSFLPTMFPLGKTETRTREDVFSIPNIKIEPLEKELDITGITGASAQILDFEPISLGKQPTRLWEGPRIERLFPDITTDITSSIQLITPIETPSETLISLPKTSMLTPTPFTIAPLIEPGPAKFFMPSFDFGGGSLFEEPRRGKRSRRSFFYTPSFAAIELNIHGLEPRRITGLEIRPITSGRKRRLF
jgi:hypothetical protein